MGVFNQVYRKFIKQTQHTVGDIAIRELKAKDRSPSYRDIRSIIISLDDRTDAALRVTSVREEEPLVDGERNKDDEK